MRFHPDPMLVEEVVVFFSVVVNEVGKSGTR